MMQGLHADNVVKLRHDALSVLQTTLCFDAGCRKKKMVCQPPYSLVLVCHSRCQLEFGVCMCACVCVTD